MALSEAWWRHDGKDNPWWGADRREVNVPLAPLAPQRIDVAFGAFMAFTFILLLAPQQLFPVLAPLRIALVAAAIAVVAHVWSRSIHGQPISITTREHAVAAYLLGWAIVTTPFSYWPGGSVEFILELYLKTLVLFWLIGNVVNSVEKLRVVAWGLVLMSIPLALMAVRNSFWEIFLLEEGPNRILGYRAPLTENPNDLALTLNLLIPFAVVLFVQQRGWLIRGMLLGTLALDILAVFLTLSRSGFLTLMIVLVLAALRFSRQIDAHWIMAALLALLLAVPLVPHHYSERLGTVFDVQSDPTGSAQARLRDNWAALRYMTENPLIGAGIGMNILALNEERGDEWTEIHNVYLQYAVDLGLPGILLFLMLLFGCIRRARSVEKRTRAVPALQELSGYASAIRISLIGFAAAAAFYPAGYHFYFYYFGGLALALGTVLDGYEGSRPQGEPPSQPTE